YKKYTDVRLVFAPEQQIAFYGGDPDNFEDPRFDLDICFFRAYENGQPARVENYLQRSKAGAAGSGVVLVARRPGGAEPAVPGGGIGVSARLPVAVCVGTVE